MVRFIHSSGAVQVVCLGVMRRELSPSIYRQQAVTTKHTDLSKFVHTLQVEHATPVGVTYALPSTSYITADCQKGRKPCRVPQGFGGRTDGDQ